ncbi:lytic transglycosylase domain-containing protein [Marinobacter gelidimuriae]|jgi:hypothetical protein|uniref:lytic transglycosylase domain-containing protein n=1 Tax=Marinobacter gelidimuriae TaxID=2739064 RepID=UPI000379AA22|nr:lytic transglycosylase domain-containing protein [Marinobacter gelidimuriae]
MFDLPPPIVPDDTPPTVIESLEKVTPLDRACLNRVTDRYAVHPLILSVIARVEGGQAGIRSENTDDSWDLGLMQINTIHLETLAQFGLTEAMIQNNDCINLGVAAWHVRNVTENQTASNPEGYFRAIARYHSKNEPHITVYTNKLMKAYRELVKQYGTRNHGGE